MPPPDDLLRLALAAHQSNNLSEAERLYRDAVAGNPDDPNAWRLLGVLALQVNRPDVAHTLITRSLALNPRFHETHRQLAHALLALNRPAEAVEAFRRAIALAPASVPARFDYAVALSRLNQLDAAIVELRAAIAIRPDLPAMHSALADLLRRAGRLDEALAPARQAVRLMPDDSQAHTALANILQLLAGFEESADEYRRALDLNPNNVDAWNNLGLVRLRLAHIDAARDAFDRALALRPEFPDARANRALALLLAGDFRRGLPEYEFRWKSSAFNTRPAPYAQPPWTGDDPEGKTILLHGEQGLGDILHLVRYAPLLAERGATVRLAVPPPLVALLRCADRVASVHDNTAAVPAPFDLHAPIASLPLLFGTTLATVPGRVPYLHADPAKIAEWRDRICSPHLRVGLAWSGSPHHINDRARSIPLRDFAPLAGVPGVSFYSLQLGPAAAQAAPAGLHLIDLTPHVRDFSDTAALVANLDLVIAVDTSVVHLAGALARPVWTLLPFGPDWRWLLHRSDSPWYPTMTLLRQPRPGAWDDVLEEAARRLAMFPRPAVDGRSAIA